MKQPYFCAVIGKGFGDEGKGMAVDFLAMKGERVLVVRHNGGAQSGHTVELPGKRFVFHELSSGSFRQADTFWADTYYPDLYKLGEEIAAFQAVSGFLPTIYAAKNTFVTLIDDVLLNMAAEEARGENRHGSCGMGIYEAQCRSEAGFGITIGDLFGWSETQLLDKMQQIRRDYLPKRRKELGLSGKVLGEYGEMLKSDIVLKNTARQMLDNLCYVKPVMELRDFISEYERVIFENGQGLLLDAENEKYMPHVTASRTGLTNPCAFLNQLGYSLQEVIYVTRSYVTRHGVGHLPNECERAELGIWEADRTNLDNPWQGQLRYAKHEKPEEFVVPMKEDMQILKQYNMPLPTRSLMITHLNETEGCILSESGKYPVEDFFKNSFIEKMFEQFYLSASCYGADIETLK